MTTLTKRLDDLPFTSRHRKLLIGSGIGWALDAMDVGLISFVMAALAVHWNVAKADLSLLGAIGFAGMAVGAASGGFLADRFGRKRIFAVTLVLYGVATGVGAVSVSLGMLIVLRFIVGLGLGAELPVASTLVSEFSPARIRGRVVVLLEAFWALGWIAAAVIGFFVVPRGDNGWRWALVVGIVPALYALYVRAAIPESVRFLENSGRRAEAEAIVEDFERAAGVTGTQSLPQERPTVPVAAGDTSRVSLWSPRLRRRTAALWCVWLGINFSYYGAFIWLPSLLVDRGFALVTSFGYTLVITLAQVPGYALAAWLIERWGRRVTLAAFLVGSALSAGLFGLSGAPWQVIATGCALSFFNLGAWGALYAIGPELYPTAVRGAGTGAAAACGRLASIAAPLAVPVFLGVGGQVFVFAVFAACFLLAAAAAFILPDRTGQALEA